MGRTLIIKGADFYENAIEHYVPPIPPTPGEWLGGLTSESGAGAASGFVAGQGFMFDESSNTNLNGHTWDYLLGKTIRGIKVWVGTSAGSIVVGYLNSGGSPIQLAQFECPNYIPGNPLWADISPGLNELDTNLLIPSTAIGYYLQFTAGLGVVTAPGYGTVNPDWKGYRTYGTTTVNNWTPFVDFYI